ncbi:MAG: RNA 3'-phosphate cyclase [Methanobacterium sp.]|nr:MAG: RNA 3'-phosphate cyclase [Methanobacterium sp.]
MIEIDGSSGEGGGAVVRISAALASLTSKKLNIKNIRAQRPRKGLSSQHLMALTALSWLCNAEFQGFHTGSEEIFFCPGKLRGGNLELDIKSAGSMALVLQAFMIPAPFAPKKVEITLKGGSDVRWAPPYDYLKHVTLPVLEMMGYKSRIDLIQRGHYPRGGGILKAEILPVKKLNPLKILEPEIDSIKGISHATNLPLHVAERQALAAHKILAKTGYEVDIALEHSTNNLSPGSGIVVWAQGNTRIGGNALGKRGKSAEKVGKEAAKNLLCSLEREATLDNYMGDQIIPYMALAGCSCFKIPTLSSHARTNIQLVKKITGKVFRVHPREEVVEISTK